MSAIAKLRAILFSMMVLAPACAGPGPDQPTVDDEEAALGGTGFVVMGATPPSGGADVCYLIFGSTWMVSTAGTNHGVGFTVDSIDLTSVVNNVAHGTIAGTMHVDCGHSANGIVLASIEATF